MPGKPSPSTGPRPWEDQKAKASGHGDYFNLHGGPVWLETGAVRVRIGWFGRVIMEYEQETRIDTRPAGAAHSPDWWKYTTRWRRYPRGTTMPMPTPQKEPTP